MKSAGIIVLLIQAAFLGVWLFDQQISPLAAFSPSLTWVAINLVRLAAFFHKGKRDRKNALKSLKEKQAQLQALQKSRQKNG